MVNHTKNKKTKMPQPALGTVWIEKY